MPRSKWKSPFIDKSLFKTLKKNKKTWSRRSTIYPAFVGLKMKIHNGKEMIVREITAPMVGHKFGELVPTRKTFLPNTPKN
ncbi:unnamed protein product [Dictyota dichotoma]|uniref:Ribosomal protein S19 n=1 Tax=Dictyota dichotoma TaxID=2876 RepID=Q2TUB7_DICDH|nr:ribosomal protein S19 [Dictyota dichotoma]AAS79078.1 ribosomal protein S19 [Dictyota dichotoma]